MNRALLSLLLCVMCLFSCVRAPSYRVPEQINDGWQVASLEEVKMDEEKLNQAVARVEDHTYQNIHAILIVKNGRLVFERYFRGYTWAYNDAQHQGELVTFDRNRSHNLASVTKSVTSILVGIALDQGVIQSVDDKVFTYFPKYAYLNDTEKDAITLKHLLTMSSGLQWNEGELPYSDPNNDLVRLFSEPDPIRYILSRPMVSEPGAKFYYGGDNTNLLGEVIRSATGQRMDAFAEEVLFGPLVITDYAWDFINSDMIHASGNLQLRPRDMAKLGQLCLNGGMWEGKRIVSEAWIAESTQKHVTHSATSGYGYQWWLKTYRVGTDSVDAYYASGWGGQQIMVFPDLGMVVVFTGGNYVTAEPSEEILTRYILPAVQK
ncbi:MAG: serine hydrolase [Anaerolineae bacterium]|nr:serine hydrolase [Anaerolineae bacterium]